MDLQTKPYSRHSAEQWLNIITQQIESGLTQKAFCQSHNISMTTFSNWKRKLNTPSTDPRTDEPNSHHDWIELPTELPQATDHQGWHMELELPGGVILRMRR